MATDPQEATRPTTNLATETAKDSADCFCNGTGVPTMHTEKNGWESHMVYTYCSCGAARDARYQPIWDRVGIPLHFQDFTLESSPHDLNVDPKSWLYLHGLVGRGKTGLAVAWTRKLIWDGLIQDARFIKVPRLLNDLRASYGRDKGNEDILKPYTEAQLLVLDDIASVNPSNIDWLTEVMYLIIDSRHDNHLTTIITSNDTLTTLGQLIGYQNAWRIQEMCGNDGIIELTGPNLRE